MREELLGPTVENVGVAVVESLTETNEKIVSNTGYQIITNKARYTLAFGEVTRSELK